MIIMALDPALSYTGLALKDTNKNYLLYADVITTKYGDEKNFSEGEKIYYICSNIIEICKKFRVKKVVSEDQFIGGLTSKKTAMQLSRLRGAIELICRLNGIEFNISNTNSINKRLEKIANVSLEKGLDKKIITFEYIKHIYKNNPIIKALGAFNDKSCKGKNSDIFDAIAILTIEDETA